jgi:hypothetical protein
MNSTMALLLEPSSTVCIPRNWLSGLPSNQTRSKIVPTMWKLEVLLGPHVEHEHAHALAGLRRQRLPHHDVVGAVEHGMRRPGAA